MIITTLNTAIRKITRHQRGISQYRHYQLLVNSSYQKHFFSRRNNTYRNEREIKIRCNGSTGLTHEKQTTKNYQQQQPHCFFTTTNNNSIERKNSSSSSNPHRIQLVEDYFNGKLDAIHLHQKYIKLRSLAITDFLQQTRRALHRHPELMYEEKETSSYIQNALKQMNITSFTTGWGVNTTNSEGGKGGYGIVVDIGTGNDPCVLLRADIDALPIIEKTEVDYKSRTEGKMHACGHDGHTAMLLGAALLLKEMEDSLCGTVRLMFQPAEEGGAGAKRMKEEGLLEMEPRPQQAFAMHVWPSLPSGSIASRPGPLLAACDRFEIEITGVGGHAAMPHLTTDPIVASSSIIMNLQTIVSRIVDPLESGVCSITTIETDSNVFNVIPSSTRMKGTVRALSEETLLTLREKVEDIVTKTADTHGCTVSLLKWSPDYYPPTVNDPHLFERFSKHVGAIVSEEGYVRDDIEPTMGAEDFSFVAESIPSTFFLLGQGSGMDPVPTNYGLHHPNFALDESVLPRGVELHVGLALQALHELNNKEEP